MFIQVENSFRVQDAVLLQQVAVMPQRSLQRCGASFRHANMDNDFHGFSLPLLPDFWHLPLNLLLA